MRRFSLTESTNPALRHGEVFTPVTGAETASIQGVVNKTAMLTVIAVIGGLGGVALAPSLGQGAMLAVVIAAALITLVLYFAAIAKPMASVVLGPIYAVIQGCFLGIFTYMIDSWLAANDWAVAGGVALQAFVITLAILASMLILYTTRIIQPTRKFQAVILTCVVGIALAYLISLPLYLFGIQTPLYAMSESGGSLLGIGLNLFILVIASLMLIIDFGIIEQKIKSGAPKRMEWFCGFILIVALAWIYIECVQLLARLAQRD